MPRTPLTPVARAISKKKSQARWRAKASSQILEKKYADAWYRRNIKYKKEDSKRRYAKGKALRQYAKCAKEAAELVQAKTARRRKLACIAQEAQEECKRRAARTPEDIARLERRQSVIRARLNVKRVKHQVHAQLLRKLGDPEHEDLTNIHTHVHWANYLAESIDKLLQLNMDFSVKYLQKIAKPVYTKYKQLDNAYVHVQAPSDSVLNNSYSRKEFPASVDGIYIIQVWYTRLKKLTYNHEIPDRKLRKFEEEDLLRLIDTYRTISKRFGEYSELVAQTKAFDIVDRFYKKKKYTINQIARVSRIAQKAEAKYIDEYRKENFQMRPGEDEYARDLRVYGNQLPNIRGWA